MSAPSEARLSALLARAGERARATGRGVLVSVSEAVPPLDPLAALHSVAEASESDGDIARLVEGGRMFWAHPQGEMALAGVGAALSVTPSGAERFAVADGEWRALLDDALVDDVSGGAPAVGPTLLGGFSFEPDGPRSALWRDFPSTQLVVPALLVTATASGCWLTLSALVPPTGRSASPDALLRLRARVLAARHDEGDEAVVADGASLPDSDVRPAAEWRALVGDAVEAIRGGALDKVVVARAVRVAMPRPVDVLALLRHLRAVHRDSYVFGCWRGDRVFVGASPERLVRLAGRRVEVSSLAGSARRGSSPQEDAALASELLASGKDRREHAMVRHALCDALAELCDDVTASDEPSLLTLPHVHHLHTAVRARLRDGHSLLDVAGALHPTPAVGGAPRAPALRFIREHEQLDRGWYAAPVGWVGRDAGELAVALRSALVAGTEATLFAGCGIVADSDPARELAESRVKLRPMQSALAATLAAGDEAASHAAVAGAPERGA